MGDMKLLERIQRKWSRAISGISDMLNDERLIHLDLYSVKGRLLRAEMIYVWKIFGVKSPSR